MSRSKSPLTREQRIAIKAIADTLSARQLDIRARCMRDVAAEQQAIAALWGRLAKRRAREFDRDA